MQKRLEVAIAATRKAGRKTLDWFGDANLTVTRKGDQSPVTAADLAAEEILKSELLDAFPDDSFLGEETGSHQGGSEFEWVVDPIDGTKIIYSRRTTVCHTRCLQKKWQGHCRRDLHSCPQ